MYDIKITHKQEFVDGKYLVRVYYQKPTYMIHEKESRKSVVMMAARVLPEWASNSEALAAKLVCLDEVNKSIDQLEFLH